MAGPVTIPPSALRVMIAGRIKARMEARGLNAVQLGELAGIAKSTLYTWLTGQVDQSAEGIAAIAPHLRATADYLLCLSTTPDPPIVRVGEFLPVPRRHAQIGAGPGFVDPLDEPKHYAFTEDWLKRMGFTNPTGDPARMGIFKVADTHGDSMENTIHPGAVLLADLGQGGVGHRKAKDGAIYVLSDETGGLQVKRVRQPRGSGELIVWGDNARASPPESWALKGRDVRAVLVGEVRWVGQEVA